MAQKFVEGLVELPLTEIVPSPAQPRYQFDTPRLETLASSLKEHGLLSPILVRPSGRKYQVVAGERRLRAAQMAGLESIPCIVRPYRNAQALIASLVENIHREDLTEMEKSDALTRLHTMTEKTWDELAQMVRLSPTYVKQLAGLQKLDGEVKEMVQRREIPARTAIALKPLPPLQQVKMARTAVSEGLSAEQIRQQTQRSPIRSSTTRTTPEITDQNVVEIGRMTVREQISDYARKIQEVTNFLDSRKWYPSQIPQGQQEEIDRLYHATSDLLRTLGGIRRAFQESAPTEAELLRTA